LASNDHLTSSINAVDLKYRFSNIKTDCRDEQPTKNYLNLEI